MAITCVILYLASVDVDRIAKEMDFQALQQNIVNVTFCNIQAEVSSTTRLLWFWLYCIVFSLGIPKS